MLCRKLYFLPNRVPTPTICFSFSQCRSTLLYSIQNPYLKLYTTSTSESSSSPSSSFTVSYLTNTCGLSRKEAIKSAKKLKLKTADKPDSVLNSLQTYGLTKSQVRNIVVGCPLVLLTNPQKTLVPKFHFLKDQGFSGDEIAEFLQKGSICKHFFIGSSLERRIQPCFNFLKTSLHSKEDTASVITRHIYDYCPEKDLQPKVEILKNYGVPQSSISTLMMSGSRLFTLSTDAFSNAVKEAVEMGVDPSERMFVYAVRAMSEVSKVKREAKIEIYKSFGWTYEEVCYAVKKQPTCLTISDEKLKIALEFFMNEMNWEPALLAKIPNVLGLSMDKRIIPRVKIVKFLISKGILRNDIIIPYALMPSETNFIKKFVAKHVHQFPELRNMYQVSKKLERITLERRTLGIAPNGKINIIG